MVDNTDRCLVEHIAEFYRMSCQEKVENLAQNWPDEQQSLTIDQANVSDFDEDVAMDIIEHPAKMREFFAEAIPLVDTFDGIDLNAVPSGVTIRFSNLDNQRSVGEYRPKDLETAMTVVGQLEQITPVEPVVVEGEFECQRCGTVVRIPQPDMGDQLVEPHECEGCERQGPFKLDSDSSRYRDRQRIRVKTPPEEATDGESKLTTVVEGSLAGEYTGDIGSRAAITGMLTVDESDTDSREFPYLLSADHIELLNGTGEDDVSDEELEVLTESATPIEDLKESILPGIHSDEQFERIKEALVLQLVGGPRINHDDGSRVRGDWHMLLLGDPGTAKSATVDEADHLAPRSQIVGERVTAAGMTASATEDSFAGSQYSIKAGAVVRANDGLCAIDEIDKISDEAIEALHNPMERQRVDAALADQDVKLPAHTAILAAGNPKYGRFDPYEPMSEQINLDSAMLSRFDLIFLLKDNQDANHDVEVAKTITENFLGLLEKEATGSTDREGATRDIAPRVIRAYISRARDIVPVPESEEIEEKAEKAYVNLRQDGESDEQSAVPVTARTQEGILRLATSSARARLSETIETEDIDRAIRLVNQSLQDVGIDPETGNLDADIVETGQSRSQQNRVKKISNIISDLEGEEPASTSDIAAEADWSIKKTVNHLTKLARKGEVYEPEEDKYRLT